MSDLSTSVFTATVIPCVGCVLAWSLFLSLIPRVNAIYRARRIGTFSPLQIAIIFPNALFNILYAHVLQDNYVFACNAPIAVISAVYLLRLSAAHDMTARTRAQMEAIVAGGVIFWLVIGYLAMIVLAPPTPYNRSKSRPPVVVEDPAEAYRYARILAGAGTTATVFGFYMAPLAQLVAVVRRRDASSFHLPSVVITFTNALVWLVYGLAIMEYPIWVPSAVGSLVSATQIFFCLLYGAAAAEEEGRPQLLGGDDDERRSGSDDGGRITRNNSVAAAPYKDLERNASQSPQRDTASVKSSTRLPGFVF